MAAPNGKKVAIVGSGPAGLTAAWHLARKGYEVTIFEAASQAGGMLRLALPPYRLPNEVVDEDVANVTGVGVKIVTDARVDDLEALKAEGYDALLLAIGTHQATKLRVKGEDLPGVMRAADFLKAAKLGEETGVNDKRVVVVGGGNVAIDVARMALRQGARSVQLVSLESHELMPAHPQEIAEAEAEGVQFMNLAGPRNARAKRAGSRWCAPMVGERRERGDQPGTGDGSLVLETECIVAEAGEEAADEPSKREGSTERW